VREAVCYLSTARIIRPMRDERSNAMGIYSLAAESMYDHPSPNGGRNATGTDWHAWAADSDACHVRPIVRSNRSYRNPSCRNIAFRLSDTRMTQTRQIC